METFADAAGALPHTGDDAAARAEPVAHRHRLKRRPQAVRVKATVAACGPDACESKHTARRSAQRTKRARKRMRVGTVTQQKNVFVLAAMAYLARNHVGRA
jgi:hypothetical protein